MAQISVGRSGSIKGSRVAGRRYSRIFWEWVVVVNRRRRRRRGRWVGEDIVCVVGGGRDDGGGELFEGDWGLGRRDLYYRIGCVRWFGKSIEVMWMILIYCLVVCLKSGFIGNFKGNFDEWGIKKREGDHCNRIDMILYIERECVFFNNIEFFFVFCFNF